MPDMDDFHAFKNTSSGSGGGSASGCGCVVAGIVVVMLIFFIASGADWDAIDSLLALGVLAFLFVRFLYR